MIQGGLYVVEGGVVQQVGVGCDRVGVRQWWVNVKGVCGLVRVGLVGGQRGSVVWTHSATSVTEEV